MKSKTHMLITQEILEKIGINDSKINSYSVHPDLNRKQKYPGIPDHIKDEPNYSCLNLDYQDYKGIELDHHHDLYYNKYRIKMLTEFAKESYDEYNYYYDALFHYCNALHFLCDSPIPRLPYPEYILNRIQERFDNITIDTQWRNVITEKYCTKDILNMINNLIKILPIKDINDKMIRKTKIRIYKYSLLLANDKNLNTEPEPIFKNTTISYVEIYKSIRSDICYSLVKREKNFQNKFNELFPEIKISEGLTINLINELHQISNQLIQMNFFLKRYL